MPQEIEDLCGKAERVVKSGGWGYAFYRHDEIMARYGSDPYVRRLLAMKESLAFVVDRLRLLVLRDEGGFWVDSDCDFQRPLSQLDKICARPEVDFVTGVRNPWRPHVALHRGVAMIDNTVMGSAKNGRMVNRMLAQYTAEHPKQTGHDCGIEVLRSIDESVILLNYERFYINDEPQTPNTILLHDQSNRGSWSKREFPPVVLK